MTDSYGNVTEADGASISVIAGKYSFEVTDGGCNSVRGTLTAGEGSPRRGGGRDAAARPVV